MRYKKKINLRGGGFYLALAQFLQEQNLIEEFGSIENRKYEDWVKTQPAYRIGKTGGLLERGKFYLGVGGDVVRIDEAIVDGALKLYYAVPLAEGEDGAKSTDVGLIGFSFATIEDMRDRGLDFKNMDVGDWDRARDIARDNAIHHDRPVWDTTYMGYEGISKMFKDTATRDGRDYYGDNYYRFWELPRQPEFGLFNWWW